MQYFDPADPRTPLIAGKEVQPVDTSSGPSSLSARELQIARAYSGGASYRQVAEQLFIAPTTVRTHLQTIYRKLGVSTKLDLLLQLQQYAPSSAN